MAKKTPKRKMFGLVSTVTGKRQYYIKLKTSEMKDIELKKYNKDTRQHETFKITKTNLGRNEVKKRK